MLQAFAKLFDGNQKTINRYQKIIDQINQRESNYTSFQINDLTSHTANFKQALAEGKTLDDILPEAFALVRRAAELTLGMRHYDVQLIAGIAFHEGKVAEQKTGEGKTLSATLALYLNALTGKGAHLVTVNDYLAQRDAGWNAPLFHALGLTVGVIYSGKGDQPAAVYDPEFHTTSHDDERLIHLKPSSRQQAYTCDITYGTNNEFGFDYLRDNMSPNLEQVVQRGHHYAIVDEVDSILIDEARTPLIISAPDSEPTKKYYEFAKLVESLSKDIDYSVDEKIRTATLTDYGLRRLEKRLNIDNLYEKDYDTIHHVEQALKAKTLFSKDTHYVVKDDQVIIVDEHTGRLMFGRRYSDGLHQAIEAKESVTIQQESRTLATISLQNYFRQYAKLAGMTGTAETEAQEFREIYKMDVVVIPTNRPVSRKDHADVVYKTRRAKFGAIVKSVQEHYDHGQPMLIGTKSIDQNDIMSRYLKKMKIPHQILNAKNHAQEAAIIAQAGRPKAVTLATNIAGRGVDIVLGGSLPDKPAASASAKELKAYEAAKQAWQESHQQVIQSGGLHVLGTDRHDSRRIDNQLRGRSGRQGDPGSSRFYVSLEDDLMRIFGGDRVAKVMDMLKIPEDQPIESGMVSKSIESAQSKVEGFHFDQRKRVVEYDDVMNKQREIIYSRRRKVLESGQDLKDVSTRDKVLQYIEEEIRGLVMIRFTDDLAPESFDSIIKEFLTIIPFDRQSADTLKTRISDHSTPEGVVGVLTDIANTLYAKREQELGAATMRQLERFALIRSIDREWMNHLDDMDDLREGIWLRGGKDQVLSEYKQEAFDMFSRLLDRVNSEAARTIFRVQVGQTPATSLQGVATKDTSYLESAKPTDASTQTTASSKGNLGALAAALGKTSHKVGKKDGRTPILVKPSTEPKVGRNDLCPCGSGLKYKKCGLISAPEHKA